MPENTPHKSGFVSIVGRPNVGKSTLLNALAGTKLSIVTDKPQTTRNNVLAIWTTDDAQVLFLDSPGIHRSNTMFDKRMMHEVRTALDSRDLLLYVADATHSFASEDSQALDAVRKAETPVLLVLNKIDKVSDKRHLLPRIEEYKAALEFEDYLMVSALNSQGLDELRKAILQRLPEGPPYYPEDQITDQPVRFLAAEMIREKVLRNTRQEVPHSVAVLVELWEEERHLTRIIATIFVEREGQKGIIIGSKGAMLKRIGTEAREEIEKLLDRRVYLELYVKVREGWRESPEFLNALDWRLTVGNPQ